MLIRQALQFSGWLALSLSTLTSTSHAEHNCAPQLLHHRGDHCTFVSARHGAAALELTVSFQEEHTKPLKLVIPTPNRACRLSPSGGVSEGGITYRFSSERNVLSVDMGGNKKAILQIDPFGRYPSRIKIKHGSLTVSSCRLFDFAPTHKQGLGEALNLGILKDARKGGGRFGLRESPRLMRSARIGFDRFVRLNEELAASGRRPLVAASCLDRYRKDILALSCRGNDHAALAALHQKILAGDCAQWLYRDDATRPAITYMHVHGFGNAGRGDYLIEEVKIARAFGLTMRHPYTKAEQTPLSGNDPFRPILYAHHSDLERAHPFSAFDYPDALARATSEEERTRVIPRKHFVHPDIFSGMSEEGRSCIIPTATERTRFAADPGLWTGNWRALMRVLRLILARPEAPQIFHCYGGRHKTGILALALRYLEDPRYYYGPRKAMRVVNILDASLGSARLSSALHPDAKRERLRHKRYVTMKVMNLDKSSWLDRMLGYLRGAETVHLNPAEQEYAGHNGWEYRAPNIVSLRNLFALLFEPSAELDEKLLARYPSTLDRSELTEIKRALGEVRELAQRYFGHQN